MITKIPFGQTGHESTRTIFGAAAFMSISQKEADPFLDVLLEYGINHIDTAASYGDAEVRLGPWMKEHRNEFFLASKTGDRKADAARESIHRSLERMQTDRLDLIQLHNLVDPEEWEIAMGTGGALEALIEAKEQGLVKYLGVTGHGTFAPAMHLKSLGKYDFDSVLFPYNYLMMQTPEYAADVEQLIAECQKKGVAVQTIKSIARRRFQQDDPPEKRSWYEPIKNEAVLGKAVNFVLSRENIFLITSSDYTLLKSTLEAAENYFVEKPAMAAIKVQIEKGVKEQEMEALFVRGVLDDL